MRITHRIVSSFVALIGLIGIAHASDNVLDSGPLNLLLVYRVSPADRASLRQYMETKGLAQFAEWKRQHFFESDKVLFSRYVDTDSWDMEIFLHFKTPADVSAWIELEHTHPAGMQTEALSMMIAVSTYQLDEVAAKALSSPAQHSVYMLIPYDYTVSTDEYVQYLQDYVQPQTDGWMKEGVLQSYSLFIGRSVEARPWSAVFLFEYKDDNALGARNRVIKQVRSSLANEPKWKAISDKKHSVRVEKAPIICEELK